MMFRLGGVTEDTNMNSDELDDLRRRVRLKNNAIEKAKIRAELHGLNNVADPDVVYLSAKETSKALGVTTHTVRALIKNGELPRSIKSSLSGHAAWAIHPGDVDKIKPRYTLLRRPAS